MELQTRNVNSALARGISMFRTGAGKVVSPRGSPTLEWIEPVITHFNKPQERVLFSPLRDANPFFHFFEGLWMLAGRQDVGFLSALLPRMKEYSDDGIILSGAYGYRWRHKFGFDQIEQVVKLLSAEPHSRRAVVAMWSGQEYLNQALNAKDFPCNTQLYFKVRDNALRMTVTCRSNDMIWGAYGANAVHFSMLQEYVADKLGLAIGPLTQLSDSFHVYTTGPGGELWRRLETSQAVAEIVTNDHYLVGEAEVYQLGAQSEDWDEDLQVFFTRVDNFNDIVEYNFDTAFFKRVVTPMWNAYKHRKPHILEPLLPVDWAIAGMQWLGRRNAAKAVAA